MHSLMQKTHDRCSNAKWIHIACCRVATLVIMGAKERHDGTMGKGILPKMGGGVAVGSKAEDLGCIARDSKQLVHVSHHAVRGTDTLWRIRRRNMGGIVRWRHNVWSRTLFFKRHSRRRWIFDG